MVMKQDGGHYTIQRVDLSDKSAVATVLALQKKSYTQEAAAIGYDRIPALFDTPRTIRESVEIFYGFYLGGKLVGLVSVSRQGEVLEVCKLVVHPQYQCRGIATKLLEYLEAEEQDFEILRVSTAVKNKQALKLYRKERFSEANRFCTADGLELVTLERRRKERS
jgi:ribosomal protein S18 acetylase RimI-like enzyme